MSTPQSFRAPDPTRRRSSAVTLILLSSVGLAGGLVAWQAWQRARDNATAPLPALPPVSAEQSYPNNYHLPGGGYYHAPYHAWFPFPFNHHDPARGYFAGGLWHLAPLALAMTRSQPTPEAVAAANAALVSRQKQEEAIYRGSSASSSSGGSGSRSTFFRSGGRSYSSSSPSDSSNHSSVNRGGFGSSGRSSSGS